MKRTLLILLAILTCGFGAAQTASQTLSLSVMPRDTLELIGAPTTVLYPALYAPLSAVGADNEASGFEAASFDASLNARSSSVAAGRLSFISNRGDAKLTRKITVALDRELPTGLELTLALDAYTNANAERWGARLSTTAVELLTGQLGGAGSSLGYTLALSGTPTAVGSFEAGLETHSSRTVIFTLAQSN